MKYALLRAAVISMTVAGIASYPQQQSNVDWPVGLLCGLLSSITFSISLSKRRADSSFVTFADPYSWTTPFFPMRKYPLRYLWVGSVSLIIGGAISMLIDFILHRHNAGFGAVFLLWGSCVALTVEVWNRVGACR